MPKNPVERGSVLSSPDISTVSKEHAPLPSRKLGLILSSGFGRIGHWMSRPVFFLNVLLVIGAACAFIGVVPTRQCGHDTFFLLDNGWRALNGQRVHVDYASPWGPLTFLIMALGLALSGSSPNGIGYANAIVGLVIALWAYGLGRDRLEPFFRVLFGLFVGLLVMAPYPLGSSPHLSAHAMVYNRYGYALLILMMIECFTPARNPGRGMADWTAGFSSGAVVALSLFLKVSYFLVALPLLTAAYVFHRSTPGRNRGVLLGFSLVTLVLLAYLRFDVGAMLRDLRMAADARSQTMAASGAVENVMRNLMPLVAVLALAIAGSIRQLAAPTRWIDFRLLFLATLTMSADLVLMFSNAQWATLPLIATFALLVSNEFLAALRAPASASRPGVTYVAAILCLGAVIFLPLLISDSAGLAFGVWQKAHPSNIDSVERFTEPRLKPILLYDFWEAASNGAPYTQYINDGAALLRKTTRSDESVLTMDMMSPFSYVLGRRPPRGGISAAAFNYTLSNTHRPADDLYFGDAAIVMVPKKPASPDRYFKGFYNIYEPALQRRYRLAAESARWYLFRHK